MQKHGFAPKIYFAWDARIKLHLQGKTAWHMLLCLYAKILTEAKLSKTIYTSEIRGEYDIIYRQCVKMNLLIPYALRHFLLKLSSPS